MFVFPNRQWGKKQKGGNRGRMHIPSLGKPTPWPMLHPQKRGEKERQKEKRESEKRRGEERERKREDKPVMTLPMA